jgi:hypothetical protein
MVERQQRAESALISIAGLGGEQSFAASRIKVGCADNTSSLGASKPGKYGLKPGVASW